MGKEEEDCEVYVRHVVEENLPDAVTVEELKSALLKDATTSALMEDVRKGKLRVELKQSPFTKVFEEFTVTQDVLLRGRDW